MQNKIDVSLSFEREKNYAAASVANRVFYFIKLFESD